MFTDGAVEEAGVTVGAFLAGGGMPPEAWGQTVPPEVVKTWSRGVAGHVVGQAEIAPVLASLVHWKDRLRGRRILVFLDNDSSRISLVKGYSESPPSAHLIEEIGAAETELDAHLWFARVPTASNPADGPSRLNFEEAANLGARIVNVHIEWNRTRMMLGE